MRKILIASAFTLALPACTADQLQMVQADMIAGVQAACTDAANAAKLYPNSAATPWANSACPQGIAAATLVQNSATIQWLGALTAQIAASKPAVPAKS